MDCGTPCTSCERPIFSLRRRQTLGGLQLVVRNRNVWTCGCIRRKRDNSLYTRRGLAYLADVALDHCHEKPAFSSCLWTYDRKHPHALTIMHATAVVADDSLLCHHVGSCVVAQGRQ